MVFHWHRYKFLWAITTIIIIVIITIILQWSSTLVVCNNPGGALKVTRWSQGATPQCRNENLREQNLGTWKWWNCPLETLTCHLGSSCSNRHARWQHFSNFIAQKKKNELASYLPWCSSLGCSSPLTARWKHRGRLKRLAAARPPPH